MIVLRDDTGAVSQCDNQGNPKRIILRKSPSTPVGARVVKGGRVGLDGRPGVVGMLTVHRQAKVSR